MDIIEIVVLAVAVGGSAAVAGEIVVEESRRVWNAARAGAEKRAGEPASLADVLREVAGRWHGRVPAE